MSFTCLTWCHDLANMSSLVTLYCIFSLFLLSLFCSQTKRKIKSCILLPRNNLKLVGFPFTTWRGWNLEVGSILTRWVESLRPNKPVGWFDPKSYVQPTKRRAVLVVTIWARLLCRRKLELVQKCHHHQLVSGEKAV